MIRNMIGTAILLCEAVAQDGAPGTAVGDNGQGAAKAKPSTEVEKVTMLDGTGRVVEFVGVKRRMLKESFFPEDGSTPYVRLDFRNGETRSFKIPQELLFRFAAHGAEQKLGDATAGIEDVDDMVLEVDEIIERLNKFEWSVKREGGGMSGTSVLLKALLEVSETTAKAKGTVAKTLDEIKIFLKARSPAEKVALRNAPALRPIIERLEAEKLSKAAKVDTGALLAGLEV